MLKKANPKLIIFLLILSFPLLAQEEIEEEKIAKEEKRWSDSSIQVIGRKKTDLKRIPGSATVIEKDFLEKTQPIDAMEVLRRVPGAGIRYQDPAGLVMNLGFRGISGEVSRKVLILEDGIPISLNPYGEPEMYYVPSIERMERIEVVKGSGSILFGPSTIGGVVNFVTKKPPIEPTLSSTTIGGENAYFSQYLSYGGTFGNTGFDISVLRKQGDGFRDHQSFFVNEINMKTITQLNEKHAITTKIGMHQQEANITYIGQTTPQFWKNPKSNYAEQDLREIERYQIVFGHEYKFSEQARLITRLYMNQTRRDWGRQNYSRNNSLTSNTKPKDSLVEYDTNPFSNQAGDTIWMRDNKSFRNRKYRSMGVDSKVEIDFTTSSIKHELDIGTRYHYDYAHAQFLSGVSTPDFAVYGNGQNSSPTSLISSPYSLNQSGSLRDDEIRQARALALYAQDRILLTDRFAIIPGLRYETIHQTRLIRRAQSNFDPISFARSGSAVVQLDQEGKNKTDVVIPGFGTTYNLSQDMTWFAGVHKGFAPARYQSAIGPDGQDLALKPETSWNYESGVRGKLTNYFQLQFTGYFLDFKDQIINSSEAGGSFGSRPINAGRSTHRGVELDMVYDIGKFYKMRWEIPFEVIYSLNEARSNQYTNNLKALIEGKTDPLLQIDTNGNRLPYVSKNVLTLSLGTKAPNGFYILGEWQYFSKQFHDLENTKTIYGQDLMSKDVQPLAKYLGYGTGASYTNGLSGEIPAYELVNVSIGIRKESWSVFIVGKNILDRKYISSRLPEGIQPGPFRQINVGLSLYL
jgi:Fe(3+) dicitrate transport protein